MNLTPENNMERILNGEDVTPDNRTEYFVKQAIANAGSGGDNDFVVTGTLVIDQTTAPITVSVSDLDKEYADIYAAMLEGKNVRLVASDAHGNAIEGEAGFGTPGLNAVLFGGVTYMPDGYKAFIVQVGLDGGQTEAVVFTFPLLEINSTPLIVPGTISDTTATSTAATPLVDIYAAFEAGRPVYFEADVGNGRGRFPCTGVELNAGVYTVVYAAPMIITGKPAVYEIKFVDSDTTGTATAAIGA